MQCPGGFVYIPEKSDTQFMDTHRRIESYLQRTHDTLITASTV